MLRTFVAPGRILVRQVQTILRHGQVVAKPVNISLRAIGEKGQLKHYSLPGQFRMMSMFSAPTSLSRVLRLGK